MHEEMLLKTTAARVVVASLSDSFATETNASMPPSSKNIAFERWESPVEDDIIPHPGHISAGGAIGIGHSRSLQKTITSWPFLVVAKAIKSQPVRHAAACVPTRCALLSTVCISAIDSIAWP